MNIEGMVGTEPKSAWAVTPKKKKKSNQNSKITGRKSTKFQMNPMEAVEGVEEKRFLTYKAYVSMANNSVKNSSIKILNHMHSFIS